MGKQAIGASIRSSRGNGFSAVIGAPQRLACEWARRADNHTGRIPTFAVGLDLRRLRGDERNPRLGAVRTITERTSELRSASAAASAARCPAVHVRQHHAHQPQCDAQESG